MACRCAPALVVLRHEVNARWPNRDKASDGCCGDAAHAARKSDHNADANGYAHAHDFDEDLFTGAGDRPLWDTLRPVLLADPRTKFCIYEARIMYPDGTNKPYTGVNAHKHHLHLSIKATATYDIRRWLAPPAAPSEDLLMRDERVVTIPPEDDQGRQWTFVDEDGEVLGVDSKTSSVTLKASKAGKITPLVVQHFRSDGPTWSDALAVSFAADLQGSPAPAGAKARIVIEHR